MSRLGAACPDTGRAIVAALRELGFDLDDEQAAQVERCKELQRYHAFLPEPGAGDIVNRTCWRSVPCPTAQRLSPPVSES